MYACGGCEFQNFFCSSIWINKTGSKIPTVSKVSITNTYLFLQWIEPIDRNEKPMKRVNAINPIFTHTQTHMYAFRLS